MRRPLLARLSTLLVSVTACAAATPAASYSLLGGALSRRASTPVGHRLSRSTLAPLWWVPRRTHQ